MRSGVRSPSAPPILSSSSVAALVHLMANNKVALSCLVLFLALGIACITLPNPYDSSPAAKSTIRFSGAFGGVYTPREINAVKTGNRVAINFLPQFGCGVSLQFPKDLKPGIHPIGDRLHSSDVEVVGEFRSEFKPDCGKDLYLSTAGRLNLTSTGEMYSGTFEFSAALSRDLSQTMRVSGNFVDVPSPW
jgi:hypothetical protein